MLKSCSAFFYESRLGASKGKKIVRFVFPSNNRVVAIFSPILQTRQTVSYTLLSVSSSTQTMKGVDGTLSRN